MNLKVLLNSESQMPNLNQKHPGCKKSSSQELKKAWIKKVGGQGLCSVTADGNKNFNNHNSGPGCKHQSVNVLYPEL